MNRFQTAVTKGQQSVRTKAGITVTYTTTAGSVNVTAVPGLTRYEAINEDGVTTRYWGGDYLIDVADLIVAGQPVSPAPGHKITDGSKLMEVLPDGSGQCFFLEPQGFRYRIHAKEVKA